MVPFAGYEMPVSFTGTKSEWAAVRENCGIFDISHMAPIELSGAPVEEIFTALSEVLVREPATDKGRVQYNALLNEKGGIIDDLTLYRLPEDRIIIIANAANRDKVINKLNSSFETVNKSIRVEPFKNYILMAVQGPASAEILHPLLEKELDDLDEMRFYDVRPGLSEGVMMISRTGYTGEDGFEILLEVEQGRRLWQNLLVLCPACGLAARDILRLEAGYPLHGNDLDEDHHVYNSGLGFIARPREGSAPAKLLPALKENNDELIRFFIMKEKGGVPREGYNIVSFNDVSGRVTSGAFSFHWNTGIGFARLQRNVVERECFIEIRNRLLPVELHKRSPYKGSIYRG